ncbi:MAG TPA: hypothetical protein DEH02_17355 [Bacteroidales bacterium]|nr:hypothetical protein [Bacteroidales bacterium]
MKSKTKYRWFLFTGILIILLCGFVMFSITGKNVGSVLKIDQIQLSQVISSFLRPSYIENLTATSKDYSNEYYNQLKDRFIWIQNHHPDIRYIYLIGKKDNKYFFYLDSEADRFKRKKESKPLAEPGEIYEDYPPELEQTFLTKRPVSVGPYTDKWGSFISAFIPILDTKGNIIAISGIDMLASEWYQTIWKSQLKIIIITVLICFIYFLIILYFRYRKKIEIRLEETNTILEQKVQERTKELQSINENLVIEIQIREKVEKDLIEKERKLKMQNEEYLSLNEELKESYNRIEDINKELKKEKEKTEESDRLKSAFLANISHEIRTPMNGILGFAELLKDPGFSATEKKEFIELIQSSGNQLLSIINDVIDISKIEAGQVSVQLLETNINYLLEDVIRFYEPASRTKKIEIELQKYCQDAESFCITDEVKLRQILMNLAGNSIKFTSEGKVSIGYTKEKGKFIFFVKDTGIGISPENHKNIFNRFWQAPNSNGKIYGGTGLGLSVSKSLVEALGGNIWLSSAEGKGTDFYFSIPTNMPVPETENKAQESKIITEKSKDIKGKTIIVAEDEEINFLYIKKLLTCQDMNVLWAKNGKEAIELLELHKETDLILMDIKMPVMDGYEAARIIRSTNMNIPIIAQTAYNMSENKTKALSAGCNDYLTKPLSKEILIQKIASLLC